MASALELIPLLILCFRRFLPPRSDPKSRVRSERSRKRLRAGSTYFVALRRLSALRTKTGDFNSEATHAVQDAGFKTAVTTIWGLNEPGDDPLLLKRFTPWETNPAEFRLKARLFLFRPCSRRLRGSDGRGAEAAASHFAAQEARV